MEPAPPSSDVPTFIEVGDAGGHRQVLGGLSALERVIRVLGKQGLAHHTERLDADDWVVWFHRDADDTATAASTSAVRAPRQAVTDHDDAIEGDVIVLDVRGLEPPEPMVRTLEALATLQPGKTLVQLNVHVPRFLLPQLDQRGFTYEIRAQAADLVRLFIRHRQP